MEEPIDIDKPLWKNLRNANKKQTLELIDLAIEETPFKTKKESMKKARRYIINNWEGIKNLFDGEKYRCSAEGHISHILSSRLSSRPMGWSLIGLDEMARMRAFKANGGSVIRWQMVKKYARKLSNLENKKSYISNKTI